MVTAIIIIAAVGLVAAVALAVADASTPRIFATAFATASPPAAHAPFGAVPATSARA